jgi:lipid-binding SYLF domain-containing protein
MTTYRAHFPPIYREAKNLVVLIEQVVRQFSRYHRYTLGTDLRLQAMQLLRLVHKAWRDKSSQSKHYHYYRNRILS